VQPSQKPNIYRDAAEYQETLGTYRTVPAMVIYVSRNGYTYMQDELYRSKVSVAYYLMTILLIGLGGLMLHYFSFIYGTVFSFLIAILIIWTVRVKTRYVLKENSLYVEGLFTRLDIPYLSITEIKDGSGFGSSFLSMTAVSMDRIKISFKGTVTIQGVKMTSTDNFFISPVRKEEFLTELRARCIIERSE